MKKFRIKTFGCQMNKDDSERIAGLLNGAGYVPTDADNDADVIIFNTCCVRRNADDRLYGQAAALKQLKAGQPDLVIAVGGCLAQMDGEAIQKKLPHVDLVFGTHNVARLPQLIDRAAGEKRSVCEVLAGSESFTSDLPGLRKHAWHAWLPITVGCDNYCTYCIVPYVRGREKSRPMEKLIDNCGSLVKDGVKEITLLGQNVNSYGRDLYGAPRFAELIAKVSAVDGLERVRFTTSHPKDLTADVIDTVAAGGNICPHFHLPLQSGSDRVLERMRRQYTSKNYLRIVEEIRDKVADVAITTDIMVGFPGETEKDFQGTLNVVRAAGFDQAFTFIYSQRPGTVAAKYEDRVTPAAAGERFARLIEEQNSHSLKNNRRLVGNKLPVFVEGRSKKDNYRLAGRTPSNKLVHIKGDDDLIGRTLDVEIREAFSWFLIGEAGDIA
ncbi:MAG: tRNA (N6-isopentenyl adenosine(37)-C2)-methylthiotransferase MiaB [Actinomycetota bacterium]|nr:tRNA (N6-isopentenyl adenosine(37)-C2)-methylthiotransferase MiaB [Actinomycetota bacterium]